MNLTSEQNIKDIDLNGAVIDIFSVFTSPPSPSVKYQTLNNLISDS